MSAARAARLATALVVVSAAALAVGCSGGGGAAATPTPSATAAATVAASPGLSTPSVAGSTYTFAEKGYAIDAPAGWRSVPNSVFDQLQSVYPSDAFFAPTVPDKVQPNFNITCQKPRADQASTPAYRDARQSLIKQLTSADVPPRTVTVAGLPAFAFDYTEQFPAQSLAIDKTDVVLVADGCRWLMTLATPAGARSSYIQPFEAALAGMKLLPRPAAASTPAGS